MDRKPYNDCDRWQDGVSWAVPEEGDEARARVQDEIEMDWLISRIQAEEEARRSD